MFIRVLADDRVALRRGSNTTIVERGDVVSAHSQGNTTRVVTRLNEVVLRASLEVILEWLSPIGVVRIHRSAGVATSKVRQLVGYGHSYFVVLDDGRRLAVGRAFQRAIRMQFGAIAETMSEGHGD
jgi:DNA-binding LytR/AlgR family response regulator